LLTTVTAKADAGPGSLRDAIANTPEGGTADVMPGLTGTIITRSGIFTIDKFPTIIGPAPKTLTIRGHSLFPLFGDRKEDAAHFKYLK
jgi:hypothetical protein